MKMWNKDIRKMLTFDARAILAPYEIYSGTCVLKFQEEILVEPLNTT